MKKNIYLDTYVIQKDMRIRLPKEVLDIFNLNKGYSYLDVYIDAINSQILLKPSNKKGGRSTNV